MFVGFIFEIFKKNITDPLQFVLHTTNYLYGGSSLNKLELHHQWAHERRQAFCILSREFHRSSLL